MATIQRGKTVDVVCGCGKTFKARIADRRRGWATSCGKSCAASKRIRDGVQRPLHEVMARSVRVRRESFDPDFDPSWGAHELC